MRRLIAISIFIVSSVMLFAQQHLSRQGEFYHVSYTIKWHFGYTNDNYNIFMKMNKFAVPDVELQLNDRIAIKTRGGDLSVVVTEEILNKKDVEGFLEFPLCKSDMRRISKGVNGILLIRAKDDAKVRFREYDTDMMRQEAKSVLKGSSKKPVIEKQTKTITKHYPSWRD